MPHTAPQEAIPAVMWSNWALVLVGIGGVYAAVRTLAAISDQTGLLRDSTEAARRSAIAAIQNLTAFKDKERARVRIEPGGVNVHPPEKKYATNNVQYKVFCYGTTPAFVEDSQVTAKITESLELSTNAEHMQPMNLSPVLAPTYEGIEKRAVIFEHPSGNLREGIENGELFIHFFGLVRYKNAFDGADDPERITKFHYVFGIASIGAALTGGPPGWRRYDYDEEANRET